MKIICYMYASLDGRIDCEMTEKIDSAATAYYNYFDSCGIKHQMNGRTTHSLHYALPGKFGHDCEDSRAEKGFYKAAEADAYQICFDTKGTLLWSGNEIDGKALVCVVSTMASMEYLEYLRSKKISYVCVDAVKVSDGKTAHIDVKSAVEVLENEFDIHECLLTGGGNINGAFLDAGLISEVHIMYGPGIDGRTGWTCAFDGRGQDKNPVVLKLIDVQKVENDTVLIKYKV